MSHEPTIRLTVAQAVVKFLSSQYSVLDDDRQRFIPAAAGIFGHGNVAGFSQAFSQYADDLPFIQGRNEQSLAHAGSALAKASGRRQTLAVTAVHRSRSDEPRHRGRTGDGQPPSAVPAARRHLRDQAPGPRPPGAREPSGPEPHRQ